MIWLLIILAVIAVIAVNNSVPVSEPSILNVASPIIPVVRATIESVRPSMTGTSTTKVSEQFVIPQTRVREPQHESVLTIGAQIRPVDIITQSGIINQRTNRPAVLGLKSPIIPDTVTGYRSPLDIRIRTENLNS